MRSAGIYVHPQRLLVYRAGTPHAAPEGDDWVLISEDSMIGLSTVRELARDQHLVEDPSALQWTGRTDLGGPVMS
jgi:hypothetical protein